MRRREFLTIVGGATFLPHVAWTQGRMRLLGVLTPALAQFDRQALTRALKQLGHREKMDFILEIRSADGRLSRLPELAARMANDRLDLVIAVNGPAVRAALSSGLSCPIVMAMVSDPLALGFVTSLSRPGGRVTGVANLTHDMAAKRLSLLKEIAPRTRRVIALFNPDDPITTPQRREIEMVAPMLGFTVAFSAIRGEPDVEPVLSKAAAGGVEAVFLIAGQTGAFASKIAESALRYRMPTAMVLKSHVEAGGLMSYFASRSEHWNRVAYLIDRLLKGAKPEDLPIEQPTKFELVINLKTARALSLEIPPQLIARVDEVIE